MVQSLNNSNGVTTRRENKLAFSHWVTFMSVSRITFPRFPYQSPMKKGRDPEWINLSIDITMGVFVSGAVLGAFPRFMRPITGRLLSKVPNMIERGTKILAPEIQRRREMEANYGPDWPDKPNDLITWLIETKGQDGSARGITCRIFAVMVAAIHTTAMALTWTIYELAAHPEAVPSLREEVESVIEQYGWSKAAIVQMRKMDSLVKESNRIYSSSLATQRKATQDFTFSDGTIVPAGAYVHVAVRPTYYDEKLFPNPTTFLHSRFSSLRDHDGESIKHQMVTPTTDHLMFGFGRHACPGRFFAVNEVKLALAEIVMKYEVRLENPEDPPEPGWFLGMIMPDKGARILVKKRN